MDFYRIFKTGEQLYAGVAQKLPFLRGRAFPPLQLVFELTYRCNLRCTFCYLQKEQDLLGLKPFKEELTLDEIKRILNQTMPWTLIIFSGGEVFVRKDALDILAYASSKRRCHIVTNGTFLTPTLAEKLVGLNLTSIGISLEGPQEVNDRVRGKGSFAKAFEAARLLVEARNARGRRMPLINIKTTITAENVAYLSETVDLADQVGANYCSIQIMNTSPMISGLYLNDDPRQYLQAPPEIEDFPVEVLEEQLAHLQQRMARTVKVRFSPALSPRQVLDYYRNRLDVRHYTCAAPWTGMNISPAGDAFPCLNYSLGSLRGQELLSVWNGKNARAFRQGLLNHGLFPQCHGCCDLVPLNN